MRWPAWRAWAGSVATCAAGAVEHIESTWEAAPKRVPSIDLVDGPLLGNGRLGAVLTWTDEAKDSDAVPSWDWGEEQAGVAFHLGHNAFFAAPTSGISSCGYTDITQGGRKALGGLALRFNVDGASFHVKQLPGNASVELSLDASQAVSMTSFIHADEDLLAVKLRANRPVEARAILWTYAGCDPQSDVSVNRVLPVAANSSSSEVSVSRSTGWKFQDRSHKVERFDMRLQTHGGFDSTKMEHCGGGDSRQLSPRGPCTSGRFTLEAGKEVVLFLHVQRSRLGELSPEPTSQPWAARWRSHKASWEAYWNESYIEMPSSPVSEKFWYMSQYILRASSSGDAAPGLYGPFITTDRPRWMGDLVLNYNAEATYYGAASSNHEAVLEPYIQTILAYVPEGRLLAQRQFPTCSGGIYFPAKILPHGITSADNGDMGQKQAALFAAVPFVQHWRHFRNLTFAKRVHEFLVGVATFWTECALTSGEDGFLHDVEDCFEELCDGSDDDQADPTMVLAFLPHLLEATTEITSLLEEQEHAHLTAWRASASKIAPYARVDPSQGVLENGESEVIADYVGASPDSTWGGLFASWPLGSIGLNSDEMDLELARRSVSNFVRVYPGMRMNNGFVHSFAAAARLNWRPDLLLDMWESFLHSKDGCTMYPNGLVDGCGHTGVENVGGSAFLNELMLQSHEGLLRIFPSLPDGLPGAFKLRAVGGLIVEASRPAGKPVSRVVITVDDGPGRVPATTCKVVSPWNTTSVSVNGIIQQVQDGIVTLSLKPGQRHLLKPLDEFVV